VAAASFAVAAALIALVILVPSKEEFQYSFETDFEGWTANGTDLVVDSQTMAWSIERNESFASDGSVSLELWLDNAHDMGKIWIEKAFEVRANRTYRVTVEYAFASADFGTVNNWRIIAGALPARPQSGSDLLPCFQEATGNGLEEPGGHVWLGKRYDSTVESGPEGKLWVVIGVWGTWESPRTYFLDDVRVVLSGP